MNRTFWKCLFVAFLLLSVSGCVSESTEGQKLTFTYELWVPLVVFLGGLVAGPAGWFLRNSIQRLGWGLMILCPIAAIGFAPSLLLDKVVVDDSGFYRQSGIWGMTVNNAKFADLQAIRITIEERRGRRGRKETTMYVVCDLKTGTQEKIPAANDVVRAALPHFVQRARDRGTPVIDQTGMGMQ
jgi:hypothetical protein